MIALFILTKVSVIFSLGSCPGSYIDYERWENSHNITRTPPIQVTMEAIKALKKCKKDGISVPRTVREYNLMIRNQRLDQEVNIKDIDRILNISARPFHEQ